MDWKKAERAVELLTGGKLTPGSGNGRVKGDVCVGGDDWCIEVKSTQRPAMIVHRTWLTTLEKLRFKSDLVLVLVTPQWTCAFMFANEADGVHRSEQTWRTCTVRHADGQTDPDVLRASECGVWRALLSMDELKYETHL